MKRLILGRIDRDFDPVKDIPVSPSCFVGREHIYSEWKKLPFPQVMTSPAELAQQWSRVRALANFMGHRLGRDLNKLHGTTYSERFWRDSLILWLLLVIQSTWMRYLEITDIVQRLADEPCTVQLTRQASWRFADDLDFLRRGLKSGSFDSWLCSLIVHRAAPSDWITSDVALPLDETPARPAENVKAAPARIKSALRKLLPLHRFESVPGSGVAGVLLAVVAAMLPARPARRVRLSGAGSFSPEREFPAAFLEILETVLKATIPTAYTTDFARLDSVARSRRYVSGKLTITGATKYSSLNLIVKAHAHEAGERIVQAQHGAAYGWMLAFMSQEIEYFFHGFFSWGWREDGAAPAPATDLPSPFLSRFRGRYRQKNNMAVFVGTQVEFLPLPFRGVPRGIQWFTYLEWKRIFFAELQKEVADQLEYKLYQAAPVDIDELAYVKRNMPGAKILKASLHDAMTACRLVIIDHPGTTLPIAIAAGAPTVCVWEKDAWPIVNQAEPFFQKLRDAKILHHDPLSAARHVNSIWRDVQGWWNRPEVRAAREDWGHQFARTSPIWWLHWARALARA